MHWFNVKMLIDTGYAITVKVIDNQWIVFFKDS